MNAMHRRAPGAARLMDAALLAATAFVFSGCVSSGTEVSADQVAKFKAGVTTEADVIAALGQPNRVSTLPDGSKMESYVHIASSMKAASYIPVVGIFAGGQKNSSETVTFVFTPGGILKSISGESTNNDTNTGVFNQK